MSAQAAAIFGMKGTKLSSEERAFFSDINPYGYILFQRNCQSPEQVRALTSELKSLSGRDSLPILIDQEGGRVARLKPPHWPKYPPASVFAALAARNPEKAKQAVYYDARLIAQDLSDLGITVDCAPLADIPVDGAHDVIGDRAFGREPEPVIMLARAMADGLMDGGIVPVLKHIPGHGRAGCDSHESLPMVNESLQTLRATDFVPFKALADLPMGMTAHVLYTALDKDRMATISPTVIHLIRDEIGFNGLLMSDDLSMKALQGSFAERTRETLAAGCDVVLHCNGDMAEMRGVAEGVKPLAGDALARANRAMMLNRPSTTYDVQEARAVIDQLLSVAA